MLSLSSIYNRGKHIAKDDKLATTYLQEAIKLNEKNASKGDADAQYNLGRIYSYYVRPAKKREAFRWFLQAARNKHMKAQFAVAGILETSSLEPDVKRNPTEAKNWYEKSAAQGNSAAAFRLVRNNMSDFDYVLRWCLPAAKKQDSIWSEKCLEIINLVAGRKIFLKKYKRQALNAIQELANSNIVMSQVALAHLYKDGQAVSKNLATAEKWSTRAFNTATEKAQAGDKKSQYELALLYLKGIGTDVDMEKTREWLDKSAKQGYVSAISALANMKNK